MYGIIHNHYSIIQNHGSPQFCIKIWSIYLEYSHNILTSRRIYHNEILLVSSKVAEIITHTCKQI